MATCPRCRRHYPESRDSCEDDGTALVNDYDDILLTEAQLEPGTMVGEYAVEGLLGEGGFGTVYSAIHPVIGKPAAIKVLKQECSASSELVSRFIAEARAVNRIRHKNIIDIFSFGTLEDGRHYYVMELLEGATLHRVLAEKGQLSIAEAMPLLRQLARALDAAHAAGIAHRDLKPENVFLTFEDERPVAKLLDFGLAKLLKNPDVGHSTQGGMPMGTPAYMSPEQVNGSAIDTRTDIYSFGVVAFEMLTGVVPFEGSSAMNVMNKHLSARPPEITAVSPELPPELDGPFFAMLEKEPAERPQTILEAMEMIETAAGGEASGSEELLLSRIPRSQRGRPARTQLEPPAPIASKTPAQVPAVTHEETPPVAARTGWTVIATLGVFAILGTIAGVFAYNSARPPGASSANPKNEPSLTAIGARPVNEPVGSAGSVVSAAGTHSSEAASPNVVLRIKTSPPDAEVFLGKDKLGSAQHDLSLPRGEAPVTLTIRRSGYTPTQLEVTPNRDLAEAIILKPTKAKDYTF